MRVVLVNFGCLPRHTTPVQLLTCFHTITGWAGGLADAGVEVAVVQGFTHDVQLSHNGVDYYFVAGPYAPQLPRWWIPRRLFKRVLALEPDVVHLNGLLYALQAGVLRRLLPAKCTLAVQHHAEAPDRGVKAVLQRWGLSAVDGFVFTGRETARPWYTTGNIQPGQAVCEIAEGSCGFQPADRESSRANTGLIGQPVFLWVGNLKPLKDPLTVLTGFESVVADRPGARLYMIYRNDELLPKVMACINASERLHGSVELLGEIPYAEMENYYNSADYLLSGSHMEGSGYALIEALACGVVPLVTDIPPFRYITGDGKQGKHWPVGDAAALHQAILTVLDCPLEPQRRAARLEFEQRLSYQAIGRQAGDAYRLMQGTRSGGE